RSQDESGEEYFAADLTSCTKPHHEQVIGHAFVDKGQEFSELDHNEVCQDKYRDSWPSSGDTEITGWLSEDDWDDGYRAITCTVAGKNESELPPGKIQPRY